ncbi:MAG TPA: multicopper oxidase domain-containing protein [Jiangellales bacterium]|nr:multicopper oxidase domain-containing protein [Jiangellales bacterium]
MAFPNQLAMPSLAESRVDPDGRRVFDLTLQRGRTDFGLGGSSETLGVDADHLGPTLRARRGEEVLVHVTNDVGEPTTLQWHGMDLPAAMDSSPHQVIAPGRTWSPTWTIDQPAAPLWYHPHLHGRTAEHVHRGLVGLFLVDDDQTRDLNLPSTYGVDDVPVMVTDRRFTAGGEIDQSDEPFRSTGLLGDTVLVNGTLGLTSTSRPSGSGCGSSTPHPPGCTTSASTTAPSSPWWRATAVSCRRPSGPTASASRRVSAPRSS